jgi:hypothetical protein
MFEFLLEIQTLLAMSLHRNSHESEGLLDSLLSECVAEMSGPAGLIAQAMP